jgi:aminomethyltransferase
LLFGYANFSFRTISEFLPQLIIFTPPRKFHKNYILIYNAYMLKKTPLNQQHKNLGAKMVEFAGWEMPVSYKSIIDEHNAVRNAAGIFDIGHMGLIKVEGQDALALIQKITTNDASKLAENQCEYSILCNETGGAVDDILVYRFPRYYLIVCNASNTEKVLNWINTHAQEFKNASVSLFENHSMLSIQGPQAEKVVGKILATALSSLKHNHTQALNDLVLSRTGYTGEDGIEIILADVEAEKIWKLFIAEGVPPCGLGARDTLRLETGLPLYGHEYDDETSPLEVGYGWAVKLDKDNFIGKEALAKQKMEGIKKKLVGLEPEGRAIPRSGDQILARQSLSPIGKVTSGTFSPTFKKPIALAFLEPAETALGNQVLVTIRGNSFPAKVVAKSFYKR